MKPDRTKTSEATIKDKNTVAITKTRFSGTTTSDERDFRIGAEHGTLKYHHGL